MTENKPAVMLAFSLTNEQIYGRKDLRELESFFLQSRFPFNAECDKVYVAVRFKKKRKIKHFANSRFQIKGYFEIFKEFLPNPWLLFIISILRSYRSRVILRKQLVPSLRDVYLEAESILFDKVFERIIGDNKSYLYLVCTQTYFMKIPSFFSTKRNSCSRIMMWYSINSEPIPKQTESQVFVFPPHVVQDIDLHYAWSREHKNWLQERGLENISVMGSMVFSPLPEKSPSLTIRPKATSLKVIFFDVTPSKKADTIYSVEASIRTLDALIQIRNDSARTSGMKIELCVKPKRSYSRNSSQEYVQALEIREKFGLVNVIDSSENLYDVIDKADLVVAAPYSSPAMIAREMNVGSVFFFLPDYGWKLKTNFFGIDSICNMKEMQEWFLQNLYYKTIR